MMAKVNGFIKLLVITGCLLLAKAQNGDCELPRSNCMDYASKCTSGDNALVTIIAPMSCGTVSGTYCQLSNGICCKGAQSTSHKGTAGKTGGSGGQYCNIKEWRKRALKRTNELRARHGVPPLTEDTEIEKFAQNYAESQVGFGSPQHNVAGRRYGENVASASATSQSYFAKLYSAESLIQGWYDESAHYKYDGSGNAGHFTQLIWKSSKKVGHGIAFNRKCTHVVMIANYYPAGNDGGPQDYKQNVPRPVKKRHVMPLHSENAQFMPSQFPRYTMIRFQPQTYPMKPFYSTMVPSWPFQPQRSGPHMSTSHTDCTIPWNGAPTPMVNMCLKLILVLLLVVKDDLNLLM